MSALAAEPLRVEKHLPAPHKFARALVKRAPVLCLPFAERCRSRLRASLSDGREVALFLARGTVLRGGDLLVAEDGSLIRIESKAQTLLEARSRDPLALARGSYHLGNRHIRVEIGEAYIRLEADPVLKDMLEGLGLAVGLVELPFEPEPGAYGGGHKHGHEESFAEDYALAQAAFVEHGGTPAAARDGLGELSTQPATYRQAAGQGGRHGASRAHQHTHEHAHQHPHEHGHAHGHAHGHDHAHHPAEEHAHGHDHGSHGESPAGTPQTETAQPGTAHRGRPAEEDAHHPLGALMAHGSHAHPAPEGTGARLAAHGASQASGD